MNLKDLFAAVLTEANIDDLELVQVSSFMWFPIVKPDQPTLFRTLHPTPMPTDNPQVVLYLAHKNDSEMYAYIVPVIADSGRPTHEWRIAEGKSPPLRYTLSKTSPTLSVESMTLPKFRAEIALEMRASVGLDGDDEDETITCPNEACRSEEDIVHVFCSECGTKLPEGEEEEQPAATEPAASNQLVPTASP